MYVQYVYILNCTRINMLEIVPFRSDSIKIICMLSLAVIDVIIDKRRGRRILIQFNMLIN